MIFDAGLYLDDGYVFIGSGAFSVVFVNRKSNRVRKLYRNKGSKERAKRIFKSELDAYCLIQNSEYAELIASPIVPTAVAAVYDKDGNDCSDFFYLDLCLEMNLITETLSKIDLSNLINSTNSKFWKEKSEGFNRLGVAFTCDACVTDSQIASPKIIDFAIRDFDEC